MNATKDAVTRAAQPTPQEKENLARQVSYDSVKALPEVWAIAAKRFGDTVALQAPHTKPTVALSYEQLWQQIQQFAAGLQALGVNPEDHVALFSENHPRWFVADQGIMTAGAVDVVRSSQADREELLYILEHSDATMLVAEDLKTVQKLGDRLFDLPIRRVVLLSDQDPQDLQDLPKQDLANEQSSDDLPEMLNFAQVMERGADQTLQSVERKPEALATLLYTSGTTGKPKGVMLTHGNLLHQLQTLGSVVQPQQGDRVLSILPTWHIYERTVEYFALSQGVTLIYTDLRHFKRDLQAQNVSYFVSVPRLLEAVYEGVQKQLSQQPASRQRWVDTLLPLSYRYVEARRIVNGLSLAVQQPSALQKLQAQLQVLALAPAHALGDRLVYQKIRDTIAGNLKQIINGGGTLTQKLDTFYEVLGITVVVGYGLTETAPVLTARRYWHNLRGSAGKPILGTEIRVVDAETRQTLSQGQQGSVLARGPQIMKGYYKNPDATQKAIDADGWFDTEDLGWLTVQEDLVLTGRVKDTIVLSNGENVEPQPIEEACVRSDYIDQVLVVGQDQRSLGALIVPNFDALEAWAAEHDVPFQHPEATAEEAQVPAGIESQPIRDLIRQELNREVKDRPGYSQNDRIGPFHVLTESFSIENGMMTQTLKVKRHVVTDRYQKVIHDMFE